MKHPLSLLLAFIFIASSMSCKNNSPEQTDAETKPATEQEHIELASNIGVYDLKEEQAYRDKVKELDLKCPNLLDPRISKEDLRFNQ